MLFLKMCLIDSYIFRAQTPSHGELRTFVCLPSVRK